ncbi:MAG TPA: prolipoprotein diacylglyceryl transferase [Candidatus Scybalocola faecipullorum]|nr:prolipoprotein diacylglyceryl transferase [Candidatus Scybalocola faecipullorum]
MIAGASIRFPHLGIEIAHMSKSVSIFGFSIAYYGIIIGIGMMAGIVVALLEAKRTKQNTDQYIDLAIFGIISAIIGARLYYVIFEWDYYSQHLLEIFNTRRGGLAIYGGIIGAVICVIIFSKVRKLSAWQLCDTACLGLITGQIIGRWANFVNMEAFGGYTDNLLAMQLNVNEAYYTTPDLLERAVTVDGIQYIQVHPTFLYESLWNLGVLIVLLLYRNHKKFTGEVFLMYIAGYGLGRFWIEGLRTDQLLIPGIGFPVSQLLSAVLVIAAAGLIIYRRRKAKRERERA